MGRLIVIGASAGGVAALERVAAALPGDLPAPVLVVLHIGAHRSILPELMSAHGPLPAEHARDGQRMELGRIYIAPPDHHMLVEADSLRLTRGPKEHHARPAIDPLFLSAALSHGRNVVGVVLTGMLDDGTFGLQAIKRRGGTAVVQDPADADQPSMPLSALRHVEVDHCVALEKIGALLASLVSVPGVPVDSAPDEALEREKAVMLFEGDGMDTLGTVATPSPFVCPDCRGGLWEITGSRPLRYRCHVGHGFSMRTLLHAMSSAADDAVWAALRSFQEQGHLLEHMAGSHKASGADEQAAELEAVAAALKHQARQLHAFIEGRQAPATLE